MALFAPEVRGPASPCSKHIRVLGHIAGASVHILVNGEETYSRVSGWPDDYFEVGTELSPGDKITAKQEFGGETSPQSPLPLVVQELPEALAHVTVATQLYACGSRVWAQGAVPGAKVEAHLNGDVIGSAESIEGIARIGYESGLLAAEGTLSLKQITCNGLSKTTESPKVAPLPPELPKPLIHKPLYECQTAINVGNILGGATVRLYRDGHLTNKIAFDLDTLNWIGLEPLQEGETIEIEQAFTCKTRKGKVTRKSKRAKTKVKAADKLEAPIILGPICPKPTLVTLTNLVPSARVILYSDDEAIGMTDAPAVTYSFPVEALKRGSKLTARMQLCGVDGPLSDGITVEDAPEPIEQLSVSELFQCASHIFLREDTRLYGKIVYATSAQLGAISGYHYVTNARFLLPVAPSLVEGDRITIHIIGCGSEKKSFGPYDVKSARSLPAPAIYEPVVEDATMVEVISNHAGALVKVYVDDVFKGQAFSRGDRAFTPVLLTEPLKLKQKVCATQALCGKTSKPSNNADVVKPLPQMPILLRPGPNTQNAWEGTEFVWKDYGAGTSAEAISFMVRFFRNNAVDKAIMLNATEYVLQDDDLAPGADYTWNVEASNNNGSATSATWDFKTKAGAGTPPPPPPPPEGEALVVFTTSLFASHDGVTQIWPVPAETGFYLCIGLGNAGGAASEPGQVVFSMSQGSTLLGNFTVNVPALQPNETRLASAEVLPMPEGNYLLEAALIIDDALADYTSWGIEIGL